MNKVKVLRNGVTIPSKFIKDIERLCDSVRVDLNCELKAQGLLPLHLGDIIYRASALKDEPVHYCYIGSSEIIALDYGSDHLNPRFNLCRHYLCRLVSYARVILELGGQLTYDFSGRHTVYFDGCRF